MNSMHSSSPSVKGLSTAMLLETARGFGCLVWDSQE